MVLELNFSYFRLLSPKYFLSFSIRCPFLYYVITGCGRPFALQGIRTFCLSFVVMVGESFEIKYGNSENKGLILSFGKLKSSGMKRYLSFK